MFLHSRQKSQTILLRKSNFQWFLFLIVICSAFVCQDFRTHINVRYLFQLFDCQLFCIFCCILMKVRGPISGLRNIRFWLFCNSTEKTKYLSTFIWKPRNLVSGSFHARCLQKLQKQLQPSTTIEQMGDSWKYQSIKYQLSTTN